MMEPHTKMDLTNGDRYAQNHSTFFILLFNFIHPIFFPEAFMQVLKKSTFEWGSIILRSTKVGFKRLIHVASISCDPCVGGGLYANHIMFPMFPVLAVVCMLAGCASLPGRIALERVLAERVRRAEGEAGRSVHSRVSFFGSQHGRI